MFNDCPTCKWCIGTILDKELIAGKKIYDCKCTCPKVVEANIPLEDRLVGINYHLVTSNYFNAGKFNCEYTPKEEITTIRNNQGLKYCFKCNTPTVKVSTGMFTMYDVCPKCKI